MTSSHMEPKPQGHLLLPICLEQEVREVVRGSGAAPCPLPQVTGSLPAHALSQNGPAGSLGGAGGRKAVGRAECKARRGRVGGQQGDPHTFPTPTAERENNLYMGGPRVGWQGSAAG